MAAPSTERPAYTTAGDRLPLLAAVLAALLVMALGLAIKLGVTDALLMRLEASPELAREVQAQLLLVFAAAALAMATGALLFVYLLHRPTHELAESIALSGLAEVPVKVPSAGSAALRLVARRYNLLVEAVARTSQQLKESAERERERADAVEDFSELILAGVPSGIVAVDAAGAVVQINTAARRILELDDAALEGRSLAELIGADHPVCEAARAPAERAEVTVDEDARARVLGVSSGEVRAAGGEVVGGVVIFADLTELRRLEHQLAMRERLASLGQVAAGLAHEIRNPLGALRGFVELLERRIEEPERARPMLEKILREVDALAAVVGDFLDFARPSPPRRQPVAVAPLLEDATEAGRAALGAEAPRVTITVEPPALEVVADAAQVRRALVNFVINAGQATGAHGRVQVGARVDDATVVLSVQDDGPGIPVELRDKLPTPFLTTKPNGTGLGLALAHQIAEAHGGELRCESPAGGGARFTLVLPSPRPRLDNDAREGGSSS